MEDDNTIKLNAAVKGQAYMDHPDNSPVWSGQAAVVSKKKGVTSQIALVQQIDDGIVDNTGIGTSKNSAKDKGAKTSWRIAKALASYYRDQDDDENLAKIDFEWSDLRYAKDQDAADRWKLVNDLATPLATTLDTGGYGVDAALCGVQLTQLNDFKSWWGKPKAAVADTKAKNKELDKQIGILGKKVDALLEGLVQFEENNSVFYNGALAAYGRDDIGVRHNVIQIVYVEDVTGVRLKNVESELLEAEIDKKLSSKVGVTTYKQAEVENGAYTLVSRKRKYKVVTTPTVKAEAGKLTRLEIRMQREDT